MLPIEMGIYYSKMLYKCYNMEYTILQTARIYSGVSGKALGWRSAVGLRCKFNRCAV